MENTGEIVKIWSDEEICARIWSQAMILTAGMEDKFSGKFFDLLANVMQKLEATRYHLSRIKLLEIEEEKFALEAFSRNENKLREAFELIFEFDAFLVQVKSSLDMLVKLVPTCCVGTNFSIESYSRKGDTLAKSLKQYRNKKGVFVEAVNTLIKRIEADKSEWLEKVVQLRDIFNHKRALQRLVFKATSEGVISPKMMGLKLSELASLIFSNNLEFQQDFLVDLLWIKRGPAFLQGPVNSEMARRFVWKDSQVQYVKYAFVPNFGRNANS